MIRKTKLVLALIFSITSWQSFSYDYDLIVIGGGLSGLRAAQTALERDKKIAVIEESDIASNHLFGDFAVKLLSKIGFIFYHMRAAHDAELCDNPSGLLRYNNILPYIHSRINIIWQHSLTHLIDDQRVVLIHGHASFIDEHTVSVGDQEISAEKFIIATGMIPKELPEIDGIDSVSRLDSHTFFQQEDLPRSVMILGNDAQAIEIACALTNMGIKVTMISKYGLLLPGFDYELVEHMSALMEKMGIDIEYNTVITSVKNNNGVVAIGFNHRSEQKTFFADTLFIARGYRPNVDNLNLEAVGVQYSQYGIFVDTSLKTTAYNIYACGDVTDDSDKLSRIADYQAKVAGYNAFCSYWHKKMYADYIHASRIVFSTVPLASAGMTEQEAVKTYGNRIQIYKVPYSAIERAYIDNTTVGFGKFICDRHGRLIGAHILGEYAGELIDTLKIGKKLSEQYVDYLFELRTPPSYFDLIWLATEQSRTRSPKKSTFLNAFLQKIQSYF